MSDKSSKHDAEEKQGLIKNVSSNGGSMMNKKSKMAILPIETESNEIDKDYDMYAKPQT